MQALQPGRVWAGRVSSRCTHLATGLVSAVLECLPLFVSLIS